MTTRSTPSIDSAVAKVDLGFLEGELGVDVRRSLERGLRAGCRFEDAGGPDELFRATVGRSIRAIEAKDRDAILPRFLSIGPYFDSGPIPRQKRKQFLSDDEVAAAIRFIHSSAINSFQGALAELLAVGPVCELGPKLFGKKAPTVFCGDTVFARKPRRGEWGKGADFHLIDVGEQQAGGEAVVAGIVEVKSFVTRPEALARQLAQHIRRARRGLRISGRELTERQIRIGRRGDRPVEIVVVPSDWALSREIRFEEEGDRTFLAQVAPRPPAKRDRIEESGQGRWLVELRWSQEALASVAYEMTFWYMGELGRMLDEHERPKGWEEMTPEEAGRNAAKMMLDYAILRARTVRESSRAIALYNSYGFGYALGAHFVDQNRRREVLFFEDLREIAQNGFSMRAEQIVKARRGRKRRVIAAQKCRIS